MFKRLDTLQRGVFWRVLSSYLNSYYPELYVPLTQTGDDLVQSAMSDMLRETCLGAHAEGLCF